MSSYLDGLKDAVGGAVCFVADKLDSAATWTFGTPPGSIRGPACNDPTPPPPTPPPFTGGQCPGVAYLVNFTWTVNQNEPSVSSVSGLTGPIVGISTVTLPTGRTALRITWNGGDSFTDVASVGSASTITAESITSISRQDGQPDVCGDPPIPPPTAPPPQPINFTYVNNEGDNVDVSGDVNIGIPILIAPFTLVAPVTVTAGGIEFNGSVTLSPNFDVTIAPSFGGSGDGPGGGGGGDGEPTEPIPPDDEDPGEDDSDEPVICEDLPLNGLVLTLSFSDDMRATELIQDGSIPSIGVPRVATLYFIARVGNRDVYMAGIDVKSRQQYIPVPFNSIVTCWRIHTEPGVSISSVRPIFGIPHS